MKNGHLQTHDHVLVYTLYSIYTHHVWYITMFSVIYRARQLALFGFALVSLLLIGSRWNLVLLCNFRRWFWFSYLESSIFTRLCSNLSMIFVHFGKNFNFYFFWFPVMLHFSTLFFSFFSLTRSGALPGPKYILLPYVSWYLSIGARQ